MTGRVLFGLVAAAGFVVVAQRRQRQLGLLGALGFVRWIPRFVPRAAPPGDPH